MRNLIKIIESLQSGINEKHSWLWETITATPTKQYIEELIDAAENVVYWINVIYADYVDRPVSLYSLTAEQQDIIRELALSEMQMGGADRWDYLAIEDATDAFEEYLITDHYYARILSVFFNRTVGA